MQRVGEENLPDLLLLRIADNLAHRRTNKVGTLKRPSYWNGTLAVLDRFREDRAAGLAAVTVSHLALNGNDIMRICTLAPCKRVGDLQKQMLEMVLDDCSLNTVETLTAWLESQKES